MGYPFIPPIYQFEDGDGHPLSGGKLYTYTAGTVTKTVTYSDADLTTANPNPIILNSRGEAPGGIFLVDDAEYKFVLTDANDAPVWTMDEIKSPIDTGISQTADELAAGVEPTNTLYAPGDVRRYGATGDGTDDSAAFNLASTLVRNSGGEIFVPPGSYRMTSQWLLQGHGQRKIVVNAYGASITTSGAISALKIRAGGVTGGITVNGLTVDHQANNDATFGFELRATWDCRLVDCTVIAYGVSATYAAYSLEEETPGDNSTGCFWTVISRCKTRKRSTSDSGDITYAIQIKGACNSTTIWHCNLASFITGVHHTYHTGETYIANALCIDNTNFQGYTTAYHCDAGTGDGGGARIVNSRFEAGTTCFSFTGSTQHAHPSYLAGNFFVSDAGTYLDNANNLYVSSFDPGVTPDGRFEFVNDGGTYPPMIRDLSTHAMTFKAKTLFGIALINSANGNTTAQIKNRTGSGATIDAGSGGIWMENIKSISGTGTEANNLRGTVTFATAATAAVTFGTAETDASYFVTLGGDTNETFWVTGKGTGGFTINSSNASSTAVVDWILIR